MPKHIAVASLAVLIILVVAAITAVGVIWWLPPLPRVHRASYEQLQKGMTEEEVEAVMGSPAGDYTTGPVVHGDFHRPVLYVDRAELLVEWKTWVTDHAEIGVRFDRHGRLGEKSFCPMSRPRSSS
jgi:hypothetical protein